MTGLKACKNSWNKRALSTDFHALCLLHLGQRILSFLKWKMNGLFPNSSHPFCFQPSFALILLHFNGKTFFHPLSPCQKFLLNLQPSSLSSVSYLSLLLKYWYFFSISIFFLLSRFSRCYSNLLFHIITSLNSVLIFQVFGIYHQSSERTSCNSTCCCFPHISFSVMKRKDAKFYGNSCQLLIWTCQYSATCWCIYTPERIFVCLCIEDEMTNSNEMCTVVKNSRGRSSVNCFFPIPSGKHLIICQTKLIFTSWWTEKNSLISVRKDPD